jgi:hypothetical protein
MDFDRLHEAIIRMYRTIAEAAIWLVLAAMVLAIAAGTAPDWRNEYIGAAQHVRQ